MQSFRVYKSGYVQKRVRKRRPSAVIGLSGKWRERWVVWHTRGLSYYKTRKQYEADKKPRGFFSNEEITVDEAVDESDRHGQLVFRVVTKADTLILKVKTRPEALEWLGVMAEVHKDKAAQDQLSFARTNSQHLAAFIEDVNLNECGFIDVLQQGGQHRNPWDALDDPAQTPHEGSVVSSLVSLTEDEDDLGIGSKPGAIKQFSADISQGPRSATLQELLELLTCVLESQVDTASFRKVFLQNLPCFASAADLLTHLLQIYRRGPGQMTAIHADDSISLKSCVATRFHVLDILGEWIESYSSDFGVDMSRQLTAFADNDGAADLMPSSSDAGRAAVSRGVEDVQVRLRQERQKLTALLAARSQPKLVRKRSTANFLKKFVVEVPDLCEVPGGPLSIAQQLTKVDCANFQAIENRELIRKEWKRDTASQKAPNVLRMISAFNRRSYWVASEVLTRATMAARTDAIRVFLQVCEDCLNLSNYYAAYSILNGLSLTAVYRLKATWNSLPSKSKQLFQKLEATLTNAQNFLDYRATFAQCVRQKTPTIPHLAVVLKDLFGFEELKSIDDDGLINWHKFKCQWNETSNILLCQENLGGYSSLRDDPQVQMVLHVGLTRLLDEEQLWKQSYKFQPRGA